MCYLYTAVIALILHLLIRKFAATTVDSYLYETNELLKAGRYTDGCSTPFKNYIHMWLKYSHDLCAAHDYGSLGYLVEVNPGIHNNLITWFAHMSQRNPVYWAWGTVVALVTLPWVVWRRNLGIEILPIAAFYGVLLLGGTFFTLYYYHG